jgi:C3HC4-type zinc finger (RING finger) protein
MSTVVKQVCPADVKDRGDILYCNGFGFQSPGSGTDTFVLCKYRDEDELTSLQVQQLREKSGAKSCKQIFFLGRSFITIEWFDYKYREMVLTEMLRMGISFSTMNKVGIWFDHEKEQEYTDHRFQELLFKHITDGLEKYPKMFKGFMSSFFTNACYDYNWTLPEGQDLARHFQKQDLENREYDNHYLWPIFTQSYDPETLMSIEQEQEQDVVPKFDPPSECMVCMSRPPSTIVHPCGHCVVCEECSSDMNKENSIHKSICILCRQPITKFTLHS